MEQELISGTIAAVVFENRENGYAVIKLDSEDGSLITVVGTIPLPAAGERLIVTGKWTAHSVYGKQFEAEFLERLLPDSRAEILAYLSSRAVKGIGPKTAEKIVERFGEHSLEILDASPERLTEINGISMKKALEMGSSFRRQVGIRRLIEFLAAYRIPAEVAVRVYRIHGEQAMELVQENPYLLAKPQFGAAFAGADALALELGFDGDDDRRVEAGVEFELRYNLNNGHTFLPKDKLTAATAALLELDTATISAGIDRLCALGYAETDTIAGLTAVYLPEYHEAECYITDRIRSMAQKRTRNEAVQRLLPALEAEQGIAYAALQKEAICAAAEERLLILTGGPGTGKTTTLAGILALFDRLGRETLLAAPTGRAAKRLSELTGREASTIHRLLEAQVSPETGEMSFFHDEDDPLKCDALIVDEMSMVDVLLMHSLLRALPEDASLILVGDPDQLPSVGPGNVIGDLIASKVFPTVQLKEIFRQSMESLIVMNAHKIVEGEMPELSVRSNDFFFMPREDARSVSETVQSLVVTRLPKSYGYSPVTDIQVLCPGRKGELGTVELNRKLREQINPPAKNKPQVTVNGTVFREGDKVMQIKNDYNLPWSREDGTVGEGVYNGDMGIITDVDKDAGCLRVEIDDKEVLYDFEHAAAELELAYAVTAAP